MENAWDWSLERPVRSARRAGPEKGLKDVPRHPRRGALESGILGAVAQLGERCVRNAEVEGSTPFRSTFSNLAVGKRFYMSANRCGGELRPTLGSRLLSGPQDTVAPFDAGLRLPEFKAFFGVC